MNPLNSESKHLKALKKLPLLQSIDEQRWASLSPHISFSTIAQDEPIFSEGSQSEDLFMVIEGEVMLHLSSPKSDNNFYLHSRCKGDTAGDFAVLNGGAHLVTAIAAKKTVVANFPREAFELLADISPDILAHV